MGYFIKNISSNIDESLLINILNFLTSDNEDLNNSASFVIDNYLTKYKYLSNKIILKLGEIICIEEGAYNASCLF